MNENTLNFNGRLPAGYTGSSITLTIGVQIESNANYLVFYASGASNGAELSIYSNYGTASTHIDQYLIVPIVEDFDVSSVTAADIGIE